MRAETIALHSGFDGDPATRAVAVPIYETVAYADTRAVFCESVGNPASNICDIEALANVAHRHGVSLIIDNTVATPVLLRPIGYGADIVVHSLTKSMGGYGTTLGGAIVDSGCFPCEQHADRFPMFTRPDASYHGFGIYEALRADCLHRTMPQLFAANRGICALTPQLLPVVAGHRNGCVAGRTARRKRLGGSDYVARRPTGCLDQLPGFSGSSGIPPRQEVSRRPRVFPMTFAVRGGIEAGAKLYDSLRLIKRLVNLGDAKSLACHPASTTHRQMSVEDQRKAGVGPETIRLSIGIEHVDDILADLDQALEAAASFQTAGE